jgi:hypothetical protein
MKCRRETKNNGSAIILLKKVNKIVVKAYIREIQIIYLYHLFRIADINYIRKIKAVER